MKADSINYWLQKYEAGKRLDAICGLIRLDPDQVMAQCRADAKDGRAGRRLRAAWTMGELGHPAVPFSRERVQILSDLLKNDSSRRVRERAARSLGQMKTPDAFSALLRFAFDKEPLVRKEVAAYLYTHANDRSWRVLLKLAKDVDARVREWAAFSLGCWPASGKWKPTEKLRPMLKDKSRSVRLEAVRSAIGQGEWSAVPVLLDELERHGVEHDLVSAVQELAIKAETG